MTMQDDTMRARQRAARPLIKADLARRGLDNGDLAGLELELELVGGQLIGWSWTVQLTGERAPLVYHQRADEGAPVTCDGRALAPLNASEAN